MGLFKKTKPEQNTENKQETKTETPKEIKQEPKKDDIEVLDLSTNSTKPEEPKENKKEEKTEAEKRKEMKKEFKLLIVILIIFSLIVFLLPTITRIFKKTSIFSYTNEVEEITENETINGMLEIGEERGSITAKKIQFYNFLKKPNNVISVVYLPQTGIKDTDSLNIYIELYNSKQNIVYRTKFQTNKKLERKVQGIYEITLNTTTYSEAKYAKVTIMANKDFEEGTDSLICTKTKTEEDYIISETITYEFGKNGLTNYTVYKHIDKEIPEIPETENENEEENIENNEDATITPEETPEDTLDEIQSEYKDMYQKEAETISKIDEDTGLVYDDSSISYTIDLLKISTNQDYKILYTLGSIKRQIKLSEEASSWSCE